MFRKFFTVLLGVSVFYSAESFALVQTGATVNLVGQESLGTQVYVGIIPNTNGCTSSGVYFLSTNPNVLALPLSVALAAKMAQKTVRVDYTKQTDGLCIGSNIYVE